MTVLAQGQYLEPRTGGPHTAGVGTDNRAARSAGATWGHPA